MHRRAATLVLGLGALLLLLTPGAPGLSNNPVPGDPTPPVVTPVIVATLGAEGWYTSNVTVNWTIVDPESIILSTTGCDARTLTADTASARLTCTAESDGGEATVAKTFKIDKTPPTASAAASRSPDANGWHNHELSVSFSGTDATSGVESCSAPQTYGGPDTSATSLSGTCRDRAGNTGAASFALKYDETAPQASPSTRAPDQNGWYNHAVTVGFQGSDATSGVNTCSQVTYAGPDDPSVALTGTCTDRAGNQSAPAVFIMKYDETAPQGGATASRGPDVNGWFNHALTVSFGGSDTVSGLDSCDPAKTYSGPDAVGASVAGACRDRAGNVVPLTFAFKYDQTAPQASATPSRQPNANGWYNASLTVTFSATDAVSGVDSCSAPRSYAGPDSATAALSGTCQDRAGNAAATSFPVKYDATAPLASATPSRQPNVNGWYRAPLTISFAATDALSGFDSCAPQRDYSGPDTAGTSLSGSCLDKAGNSALASFPVKYDATAPLASATPSRQPNANGWYNASLTVTFSATDALSGLDSCTAPRSYAGPDSASAALSGTCQDLAGNAGAASFALKYDATAPQASATPSRQPNANGWYNTSLTVSFAATDALSGFDSCDAGKTYSGPDAASASVSGSCRDRAGNGSLASFALKYDATPPQASATPSRQPNANGWYNASLTVSFAATDGLSGLDSCDAGKTYSGPDAASASVSGSCRDRAGNGALASFALKYDATGPAVTAAAGRIPDENGWYNHPVTVGFAATDAVSGFDSCSGPQSYSGPDSGSASVSGSCVDKAGNTAVGSFVLGYDATAPQSVVARPARPPDANDWYNAPIALPFQGTDPTSGVQTCTQVTYGGPDTIAASVTGSCRDRAGNQSGPSTFQFKYDGTAPQVTGAVAVRAPDQAGWYNRPIAFAFVGNDTMAGLDSCPAATYTGPDSASASVAGACVDKAGNRGSRSFALRYDATGPEAVASADREPGSNGWYNRPVTVSFSGSDAISGLADCAPPQSYDGPDGGFAVVGGTCFDKAGNVGLAFLPLRYDATAPQVTGAAAARPPDSNGWYNRPLAVTFHGSDVTSEIDACTVAGYSGPDAAATTVSGSCRDRAGNGSALASFPLRYDSKPPSLLEVKVKPGNRSAVLSWRASPDTNLVEIVRTSGSRTRGTTVYRGAGQSFVDGRLTNGTEYRYAVTAYDEARNSSTRGIRARPTAPLFAPAAGAAVTAPPRLAWKPVPNATYYNVQLWRNGKIFSAWPKRASLKLRRSWRFEGRRYRLLPGRYRWYVWPGYGRRAAGDYGRPLGSSSFVVTR